MEKLSKNFIWMAAANIASSLFSIALFVYLARILMPEAMGYLSYAFTAIFFLFNFVDLGMSTYGIREVAKNKERVSEYVSEIVSLRFIIASFLAAALIIVTLILPGPGVLKLIMVESSLMLLAFGLATEWAFQGIERMPMVFVSLTATSALQFGSIYMFVKGPDDLSKVPVLYFASSLPVIIVFLRKLKFKAMRLNPDIFRKMRSYLSGSFAIWLIAIFVQVYNCVDLFMLGAFRSIEEVGYFTIARRMVGSVALFMVFLVNAALPRFSAAFCENRAQFDAEVRKFLNLAVVMVILLMVPIMFFGDYIISAIFGAEYIPASLQLKLLIIGLVFVIFNLPYSTGLIACGFEKDVLRQAFVCAVINVAANLALMPGYGMLGASVSFILTEAMALILILLAYRNKIGYCVITEKRGVRSGDREKRI